LLLPLLLTPGLLAPALAQQNAWIQIEAHPDLRTARERASAWAGRFDQVRGFRLRSGWYAIVIGPVGPEEAAREVAVLRRAGQVPGDSFVATGELFTQQFFPVEADAAEIAANLPVLPATPGPGATTPTETAAPGPAINPPLLPEDESPAEARRSESLLDAEERRALQTALAWFGHYDAAIDGAFGPGTRSSMAEWQAEQGFEATGVLTTRQRAALMAAYRETRDRLGPAELDDDAAGISLIAPRALVRFARYEPPFVHYDPVTEDGVRLLLISQPGDRATLHGLYDIMQTLEIVPLAGERARQADEFLLTGQNAKIASYTYARLAGPNVKGFTLVWPRAMDAGMQRVVAVMRDSFDPSAAAVLDPARGGQAPQRVDLLAGLDIRRPALAASGFYIDARGHVLTAAANVADCARITLDGETEAEVALSDPALGLALLAPKAPLAPLAVAELATAAPRLRAEMALAGYSFGGVLSGPTVTFGTLEDLRGLRGEEVLLRLSLRAEAGDAGGPVLAPDGAVAGLLLPPSAEGPRLPGDVAFVLEAGAIAGRLAEAGLSPARAAAGGAALADVDLVARASAMTVLVACWN
jgi:peptidoglycan hydrolase-like protein with peptidoglycan-binding domain